jgi:soluble lytic murein transglycosylase-like protein
MSDAVTPSPKRSSTPPWGQSGLLAGLLATGLLAHGLFGQTQPAVRASLFDFDFARAQPAIEEDAGPSDVAIQPMMPKALSEEMRRVRDYVAKRYNIAPGGLEPVLKTTEEAGKALGIDPFLLVAMMAIESSFNPMAQSRMGAQGLMQVIPHYHMDKLGENPPANALLDPDTNIRVGALVLKEGLQRFGSLQSALQYYNGALSDSGTRYANRVLALKRRLKEVAQTSAPV